MIPFLVKAEQKGATRTTLDAVARYELPAMAHGMHTRRYARMPGEFLSVIYRTARIRAGELAKLPPDA